MSRFRQILHLNEGYVEVTDGVISIQLWVDVEKPVVHVDMESKGDKLNVAVTYENWRTQDITMTKREAFQSSYKFAAPKGLQTHHDSIVAADRALTFMHCNGKQTIFDVTVAQQTMDALDVCIFLNGFPIITVELKNRYTGQTYKNAIK